MKEKEKPQESPKENTPESESKPAPTAEELNAIANENLAEFFDNDRLAAATKPKKAEPAPDQSAPAAEVTPETPKPQDPAAPAKKPAKPLAGIEAEGEGEPDQPGETEGKPNGTPAPVPRGVDDEMIDEVAERLAKRLEKPTPESAPEKDPFEAFGRRERGQLQALTYLQQHDPRFKGRDLVKETTEFWKKEQDYIAKWQKEHVGEEFSGDDSEHGKFYRDNEPRGIDDQDIEEARIELKVAERTRKEADAISRRTEKAMEERLAPIERQRLMAEKLPEIKRSINESVAALCREVVPNIIGDSALTDEVVAKLEAEDPEAYELVSSESAVLNHRVRELENMRHLGRHFEFDPEKTVRVNGETLRPHAEILSTAEEIESKILSQPEAKRIHEGRQFITRQDLAEKRLAIAESKLSNEEKTRRVQALDQRFWYIGLDDIRAAFILESAKKVKRSLDLAEKRAKRVGEKKATSAETLASPNAGNVDSKPGKTTKTAAPPITSESDMVHSRIPGNAPAEEPWQKAQSAWFS